MKSNSEILGESLRRTFGGRWFWRLLAVTLIVSCANNLATGLVQYSYQQCGLQTWIDFLGAKAQAMQSGLDYSVPSRAVAHQMNCATAFYLFIAFIFGGIMVFGVKCVSLKTAREEERGWCGESLGGFARPLGVALLFFLFTARVFLWSLLLVVPGMVATYRYAQCWNVKVENPDWSASRCLAESARMMDGFKMRRFLLDLCFFGMAAALFAAWLVLELALLFGGGGLAGLFPTALFLAGLFVLSMWMYVSHAIFYRELKAAE